MDYTANFYSQPSYVGAGFPIFAGSRRQRGGSIFGALKSLFMPMAKSALKRGVKAVGEMASDVVTDALDGQNIGQSIMTHGKRQMKKAGQELVQQGRRVIRKQVRQPPRRVQRKRPATAKAKQKPKRPRYNY